ncbi:ribosomal protein S5 domain 2-type protein, partial [Cantharellus anzutake]|uniref:ribosomal protein S5 domain 2-type protein n=1 Tax=Cantharellus anzutake TaxID=1750568 RepID=UPI001905710F
WPWPIFTSSTVTVQKSSFIAAATRLTSPAELPVLLEYLRLITPRIKKATHPAIYAYRTRLNHSSSPSTGNLQFAVGHSDDGEHGAGLRLERLLQLSNAQDCAIVVTRWHGGVPLGSARWKCISKTAKEALALHKK